MLLSQLDAALSFLSVDDLLDERPWTTGPRRSTAMVKFKARDGEGLMDVKQRMIKMVTTFAQADYKIAGEKLWCTFSKSPEERARAGHASLVKRVLLAIAPAQADLLDLEHSSGSAWIGSSKVACCVGQMAESSTDKCCILHKRAGKGWIDMEAISREAGVSLAEVRAEVERQRR